MTYVIAAPSIVINASTGTILPLTTATGFFLHGETNSGGVLFTGSLVYSGLGLPTTATGQIAFATGIAAAYTNNTLLKSKSNIKAFIDAAANVATDTGTLLSLGGGFIGANLGGSAVSGGGGGDT